MQVLYTRYDKRLVNIVIFQKGKIIRLHHYNV
ncbi:hypothetical protein [Magpiepox virus 2]|nr:hypothetical protein [Magpiepox virus 2]